MRQLEHELERAAIVCETDGIIEESDLSDELLGGLDGGGDMSGYRGRLRDAVEQLERRVISATLTETQGNILKTSKLLGLTRKGLKDKMTRYGIAAKRDS